MTKKFWMVYVEGQGWPVRQHETEQIAREEARRLALKGNQTAYVLEAVARCTRADVVWEELVGEEHVQA